MIKVEEAISNLQNQILRFEKGTEPDLALQMAIEALQERKTGKWIDRSEDGYVECPFCGHLTTCEGNIEDLHYCFWCGAKMEAADERHS